MTNWRKWTKEDEEIVINLQHLSTEDMLEAMPYRTKPAITARVGVLRKRGLITVDKINRKSICNKCSVVIYHNSGAPMRFCDKCKPKETCLHCKEDFELVESKIGVYKFCSIECRYAKPEYHPMFNHEYSTETRAKMSKNNWLHKIKESGGEMPEGILDGLTLGHGWMKGLTKETSTVVADRAVYLSELYKGKANPEHSKRMTAYYEKHPERHPNRILSNRNKKTKIEQIMFDKLTENNIPFEDEYRILRFYADFALLEHKIVIECDGAYWHDAEKDSIRDNKLNNEGWRVVRFSESEIHSNPEKCIEVVKRLIS